MDRNGGFHLLVNGLEQLVLLGLRQEIERRVGRNGALELGQRRHRESLEIHVLRKHACLLRARNKYFR